MGILVRFLYVIDGGQGSESAGLAGAGSAKFAFSVCWFIGLIANVSNKEDWFIHEQF